MVEISVIMQSLGEVSDDNQLTNQLFLRDLRQANFRGFVCVNGDGPWFVAEWS